MDFHSWPRPSGRRRSCRGAEDSAPEVDLDHWVEMANRPPERSATDGLPLLDTGPAVEGLTQQLLEVLDDESASMVPSTASHLSQREWERMPVDGRARLIRRHLATLDPRLLPRTVEAWAGRRLRQPHR